MFFICGKSKFLQIYTVQENHFSSDINSPLVLIRIAVPADGETVADIGRRTFYETWKSVNTEEDLQLYMLKAFDAKKVREEIENSKVTTFFLAFVDDELAGYAKLRNDRNYDQNNGLRALEMERIYVLKKFQDQKIGKALMDECLKIAYKGEYEVMWLGVNQENHKAIDFYKKYGFEVFGTKQFILGTAIDEDFVMKKMLK
jgi:ribosomal protein S18 acetylase RimI-like enzyme